MRRSACASRRTWVLAVLLVVLAGGAPGGRSVAQRGVSSRVVAIADIHGDAAAFSGILTHAGLIDANGRWSAGNTTFVQTGDYTDRGATVRAAMDILATLETQATAAGGRVAVLLGNHEIMNMVGEVRDVTPAIYATFADERSEQRREDAYAAYVKWCAARSMEFQGTPPRVYQPSSKTDWMAAHPPGFIEYREAFGPQGRYGRWLRAKQVVLRVNDTAFMHAGINPDRAPDKLEDINKQVRDEVRRFDQYRSRMLDRRLILPFFTLSEILAVAQVDVQMSEFAAKPAEANPSGFDSLPIPDPLGLKGLLGVGGWALFDPDGPLWFRGFATWSSDAGAIQMKNLLQRYSLAHFVVGHTVLSTKRITPRFGGGVFLIDTGMSSSHYPGGTASALEIQDGRFTAIYPNERTPVFETPASR